MESNFSIEDLRINKLCRNLFDIQPSPVKFAEYILRLVSTKKKEMLSLIFFSVSLLILMFPKSQKNIFNLVEKIRKYLQFFLFFKVAKKIFFLQHKSLSLAD